MPSLTAPVLSSAALSGFALRNTAVGRALSPPMCSFSIALGLSNVGALPVASPFYDLCSSAVLPLSVALGLVAAGGASQTSTGGTSQGDTRPLKQMLIAFCIGALGTLAGALAAFRLRLFSMDASACAAGLMCATYIGGSANFFGVATATKAAARFPALLPSLLAADLALMGIYLLGLTAAARSPLLRRIFPLADETAGQRSETEAVAASDEPSVPPPPPPSAPTMPRRRTRWASVGAIGAASAVGCAVASALESTLHITGSGTVMLSAAATWAGRVLARRAPQAAERASGPLGNASILLGCLFLASVGASARLAEIVAAGPAAAVFAGTVLLAHSVLIVFGAAAANRFFGARITAPQLVLASNANVGGAGTSVAMASAMGWTGLIAPAATCGAAGYAGATGIGVALSRLLTPGAAAGPGGV